ncbi:MAG: biotin/lipoyl-containing protein [Nitriliruptorales bacterium]|nr:biotin/lipoyl-containing protein [Nitriliruptorales bacterium]
MAEEVKLPELGESITEGIITEWLVAVGDTVAVDQPIVEISTDKVDTEIPSPVAGVVTELRADVDDTIEVGQVIAIIGEGDASAETGDAPEPAAEPAADSVQVAESAEQEATPEPAAKPIPAATPPPAPEPASPAPAPAAAVTRGEGHTHDVVVIGGGTGGYSTALRAAQLGLSVALVEKDKVGGTCLHWGCIPTKALLQSAEIAEHAQSAADFGVSLTYEGVEIVKVNEHKQAVVDRMHKGLQGALKGRGVETIAGTGRLTAADTVEVTTDDGTQTVSAPAIVVATGSVPRELPFAPFDGERVISSDHALGLDKLPGWSSRRPGMPSASR